MYRSRAAEARLLIESYAEDGPDALAWGWANVCQGSFRYGEARHGHPAEVDPATLAGRLLAEAVLVDGYVICL